MHQIELRHQGVYVHDILNLYTYQIKGMMVLKESKIELIRSLEQFPASPDAMIKLVMKANTTIL